MCASRILNRTGWSLWFIPILGIAGPSAVQGRRKDQVYLVLEACNGMIVENDFIVSPDIHLGGEEGPPIQTHFSVIPNLVIVIVDMNFLGSDQLGKHDLLPFTCRHPYPFPSFSALPSASIDAFWTRIILCTERSYNSIGVRKYWAP